LSSIGFYPASAPLRANLESLPNGADELVQFGLSVLIAKNDANRLVVGAPNFGNGGAVFVYDFDGTDWVPLDMSPILGAIGDSIGSRMSLSTGGSYLAVRFKTFVRIIHLDATENEVPQDIPGGGATVSLSYDGSLVAVSAEGFNSLSGRVLLYTRDQDGSYTLLPSTPFIGDKTLGRFGWATAFNEEADRLVISAPFYGSGESLEPGSVYVYEKQGSSWQLMGQPIEGTNNGEAFGFSLALNKEGDYLAVGSPGSNVGGDQSGKVSVFKWESSTSSWTNVGGDLVGDGPNSRLGRSVDISGDGSRIAVSSFASDDDKGRVELYDLYLNGWVWTSGFQGENGDNLGVGVNGISMTFDGQYLVAGAAKAIVCTDENSCNRSGEVYLYKYLANSTPLQPTSTPSITPSASFAPSSAPSVSAAPTGPSPYLYQVVDDISDFETNNTGDSQYGFAIDMSDDGNRLVVGAPKLVSNSTTNTTDGGVFMYTLTEESSWNLIWSWTGNADEKLGNRLSLNADGSRLALRRHNPRLIEIYNISASGVPVLVANITQENRGDTVTLSPDGKYLSVSEEFLNQGRGSVTVYFDSQGDGSTWTNVFSSSLSGTNPQTRYGWATAFSNAGTFCVSAPNFNGPGVKIGLVHVFNMSTWSLEETFTGSQDLEQLGFSMALSSDANLLILGSPGSNGRGLLQGQVSTFRFADNEWIQLGSVTGSEDNDRIGRSLALSNDGTRLAATSLFHDGLSGQVVVYDLVGDSWNFVAEREGYLPGDRLGFGAMGLTMTGDGTRLVAASLATNGTDVSTARTFDVIDPSDEEYNDDFTPPEFEINGCVCNEVKVCLDTGVEPGSIIYLCLNTNTGSDAVVKFVGIEELALVEQDVSRFTYKSIHEGKSEFGTFVDVDGSKAFIQVPLMSFFSGLHDVSAEGVALFQHEDSDGGRRLRSRIVLDSNLSSQFSVDVTVVPTKEPDSPTSAAALTIGSLVTAVMFLLFGLVVDIIVV
jgi:hypothetical protein